MFDIQGFINFCKNKGDEKYNADDSCGCPLGQYGYPGMHANNIHLHGIPYAVYFMVAHDGIDNFHGLATVLEGWLNGATRYYSRDARRSYPRSYEAGPSLERILAVRKRARTTA